MNSEEVFKQELEKLSVKLERIETLGYSIDKKLGVVEQQVKYINGSVGRHDGEIKEVKKAVQENKDYITGMKAKHAMISSGVGATIASLAIALFNFLKGIF